MNKKQIRHSRIMDLERMAISNKYTWKDLKERARKYGISEPTARDYLEEVYRRLQLRGFIK